MTQVRIDQLEKQNREIREEAEKKLKDMREKYEGVIQKYNDKDEECKQQDRELTLLKRKINICETEFHKLESARDQLKIQQKNSLMQIADLQRQKSEVEKTLKDKESNCLKMQRRLQTYEQEKKEMNNILDALKEEMKEFKEEKEKEATEFNEEIVRLMQEIRVKRSEELIERKKRKDEEKISESIRMEILENLKNKKGELMTETKSQKTLIGKLEKKINQLEKDNRKWENLYADCQKENQKLQPDSAECRKKMIESEKRLRKAEKDKVELEKELTKVKSQFGDFKPQVDKKMKEKTSQTENSQKLNGDLKTKNSELKKKCEQLNEIVEDLKKQDVQRLSEIELLKTESTHLLEVEKIQHEKTQKEVEKLQFQKSSLALQVKGLSERLAKSQKELNQNRRNSAIFGYGGPEKQSSLKEDPATPLKVQQHLLEHKLEPILMAENYQQLRNNPTETDSATNFANGIAELTNDVRSDPEKLPINTAKDFRGPMQAQNEPIKPLSSAREFNQRLNFGMSEMFEANKFVDKGLRYESLANQKAIDRIMENVNPITCRDNLLFSSVPNERSEKSPKISASNHEEHSERVQQTPSAETPLANFPLTPMNGILRSVDQELFPNRFHEADNSREMYSISSFRDRTIEPRGPSNSNPKIVSRKFEQNFGINPDSELNGNSNFESTKEKPDFLELKPPSSRENQAQVFPRNGSSLSSKVQEPTIEPRETEQWFRETQRENLGRCIPVSKLQSSQESSGTVNESLNIPRTSPKASSPVRQSREQQKSFDEYSNVSQDLTENEPSLRSSQISLLSTGSQDVYDNIQTMIQKRQEKYRNHRNQGSRWSGTNSMDDVVPDTPKRERPEVRPRIYSTLTNPNDAHRSHQMKRESEHNLSNACYSSSSEVIITDPAGYNRDLENKKLQFWKESQEKILIVENENQKLKNKLSSANAKVAALENERNETDELIQRMSDSGLSENISTRKSTRRHSDSSPGRKKSREKLQEDLEVIERELVIAITHQELLESRIGAQDSGREPITGYGYNMEDIRGRFGDRKLQNPVIKKPLLEYSSNATATNRSLRRFNSFTDYRRSRVDIF